MASQPTGSPRPGFWLGALTIVLLMGGCAAHGRILSCNGNLFGVLYMFGFTGLLLTLAYLAFSLASDFVLTRRKKRPYWRLGMMHLKGRMRRVLRVLESSPRTSMVLALALIFFFYQNVFRYKVYHLSHYRMQVYDRQTDTTARGYDCEANWLD